MPRDKESPWYSTPADKRHRKPLNLSLPDGTVEALGVLMTALGLSSRAQVVETLVRNEMKRKRLKHP